MKSFYIRLLIAAISLCTVTHLKANQVIVKGHVLFTNGKPVANHPVTIATDTLSGTSCPQYHLRTTDSAGFYIDTLTCVNGNIVRIRITTTNCDGRILVSEPQVLPSNVVESNFTICNSNAVCQASFTFTPSSYNNREIRFSSSASTASAGDSIISRSWAFGDSSYLTGNIKDPQHTYQQPGKYTACLKIKTASGCESSVCKVVTISEDRCKAKFTYTVYPSLTGLVINFNSSASETAQGDSIRERIWRFGDGTSLSGNVTNPTHSYTAGGPFNVCLVIRSSKGCVDSSCITVPAQPPVSCKAKFTSTVYPSLTGLVINFNSSASETAQGDSIRERIWRFGDGTSLSGNVTNPTHSYTAGGPFNVCLVIRSTKGCVDSSCITIPGRYDSCKADFSYTTTNTTVKFVTSVAQTDTIVSRLWQFGDGVSLTGNIKDPAHTYAKAGTYTVCLTIKTSRNCESRECKQVVINDTASTCTLRFAFEQIAPKKIRFNSNASSAAVNDDIIQRKWDFGDGSPILSGNITEPVKEYHWPGVYTVCMQIRTLKGCEKKLCSTVRIGDATDTSANKDQIKIISLYPSPVRQQLTAVIWSLHNNVNVQLSIHDIYGVKKWSMSRQLLQGNNIMVVPTELLMPGPYFFKVTSMYGIQSRQFFRL